ncbi:MAG: SpoIIE family protein phosphatase [Bacteroidota bacterium]
MNKVFSGLLRITHLKRGLAFKFIVFIFSSVALIFTLIVVYNYSISTKMVEKNLRMNAENLTKKAVAQIEKILTGIQKIPDNYSRIMENTDYSKETLISILKNEVVSNPDIYGAAIAFVPYYYSKDEKYFMAYFYRKNDTIALKYLLDESYDYFTMDWYQIPKELDHPDWSEPYFDEGAGNALMATYSVPLYQTINGQRQFIGILTADVSLDWLERFVNSIKVYETGYGFVISKNGTIATHPMKEMMMNETIFSIAEAQKSPQLRTIGRNMIRGEESFAELVYRNIKTGKLSWIAYAPITLNGWSIGIVFPVEEFMADVNGLFYNIIVLGAGGLIIIFLVILFISRSITRPLRNLTQASKIIAEGNFNVVLPEIKTRDEMMELHDSFDYMQKKLAEYIINLQETTSAREKIESELRIAREIQMGMIPHLFPPFPNLSELDLFAVLKPAKEVGGDLYDFFLLGDDKLCFAIGDVSGKGVPASLFMAVTRTLLRSVADKDGSPSAFVTSLNKSLSYNNESSMFVTFFVGVLNLHTGEIKYSNAGHNPPIIIRDNGDVEMFELSKSIPVGLFEDFTYTEASVGLNKGDKIFMYTDGVTEAENCDKVLYSPERLVTILEANTKASPDQLIKYVEEDIMLHVCTNPQSDDITMMTIIYNG